MMRSRTAMFYCSTDGNPMRVSSTKDGLIIAINDEVGNDQSKQVRLSASQSVSLLKELQFHLGIKS